MTANVPSKFLSGSLPSCKSFLGSLTYQVTFYLSRQTKSKGKYLRLDIIAQLILFFNR